MFLPEGITIQGHRGCRAILPENTLPAFMHAASIGVHGIELDVVITADHQLLVSHEPWMHHETMRTPDNQNISKEKEKDYNIYKMFADEAQRFLCGRFPHPRFPSQLQTKCYKPLLREVVHSLSGTHQPWINIELKSQSDWYGVFQPDPASYASIFLKHFLPLGIAKTAIVQSFDAALLREIHALQPDLNFVLLSETLHKSTSEQLAALGFIPKGFSPHYSMISPELVKLCRENNMELITWTVNEVDDFNALHRMGIRHFITDDPEKFLREAKELY